MIRAAVALEQTVRRSGVILGWTCLASMIVLAALEPVSRWAGWAALPLDEGSTSAFFALTMLSFGYAYVCGAHVRLDVLSRRFTPRTRAAIELCGVLLIVLPLCLVVIGDGMDSAWRSFQQGERWGGTELSLQWLLRSSVPLGFLFLLLAAVASALRALDTLTTR